MGRKSKLKNLPYPSLVFRLLKIVFSLYLIVALLLTGIQISTRYVKEKNNIIQNLTIYHKIFVPSLATALWNLDEEQIKAILQGMIALPELSGVQVLDLDGALLYSQNKPNYPLNKSISKKPSSDFFYKSFTISYENIPLAKIYYFTNKSIVIDKIKTELLFTLIYVIVQTILIGFLFIWAFKKYLEKELNNFIHKMEKVDFDNLSVQKEEMSSSGTKEIERLKKVFTSMLNRLSDSKAKLNKLNLELEEKVIERTQQLEQLTITDELTGIYNRRYFNQIIEKELKRAKRWMYPITLILCDIDYFKNYNDTYGHKAGDEILKKIASLLKKYCQRSSDYVFRIGGEEFAIISTHQEQKQALLLANKIKKALEKEAISHSKSKVSTYVTMSFGIFNGVPTNLTSEQIYILADKTLYKAKEKRNCIEVASLKKT